MQLRVPYATNRHSEHEPRPRFAGLVLAVIVTLTAVGYGIGGGLEQGLEITRSAIGGGVIRAAGGGFELSGTIGQPTAGVHSGGGFELVGGFWFPIPPGDYNDDGLVNLLDYAAFNDCLTGPGGDADGFDCAVFDVDQSGDVDLLDFAEIQRSFSGM